MPRVQFNGKPAFDSNTMWGYVVEVTEEGTFGEVPDELLEIEVGAGRVQKIEGVKKAEPAKVAEDVESPKPVEEVKRGPGRPKSE